MSDIKLQQQKEAWLASPFVSQDLKDDLLAETDDNALADRFYKHLAFGTGGLRGIMGAGTNRMNAMVVARASAGVGAWVLECFRAAGAQRGVAIAYDSRCCSVAFAQTAADALTGLGIVVHLFPQLAPTPMLSFAVRWLGCVAGVVITASHNPKEYNGYKVYDETGCQITQEAADAISQHINAAELLCAYPGNRALCRAVDKNTEEAFYDAVASCAFGACGAEKVLPVVYSPLHGTGNVPVCTVLERAGFPLSVVKSQQAPDGAFPTVDSPNPEEHSALHLAIEQARREGALLAFGTDPDCDRIGTAVRHKGDYRLLTGNQLGALLLDYIIMQKRRNGTLSARDTVVTTIVTGGLGASIAKKNGLNVRETLTGFKYIGEQMNRMETDKDADFLFGYEESYGYLVGTYARDKDAVGAALLLCEMAAVYQAEGKTLVDRLDELYAEYGVCIDALDAFTLKGQAGAAQIAALLEMLKTGSADRFGKAMCVEDYAKGLYGLPPSGVLKFCLANGSWLAVRASGTEPKVKFYYSVRADTHEAAGQALTILQNIVHALVKKQPRKKH